MNTVYPIKDRKKLAEILAGLERETDTTWKKIYLLFATGIYTGLRISDIVPLQKRHVMGMYIETIEQKTGKRQQIALPQDLRDIYDVRLKDLSDTDYIFPSRKNRPDGAEKHISERDAGYYMQKIKTRYNIQFPFACHSMRKTFGYMRYKYNHVSLEILRLHFNHADEATTRRYIGIDEEERNKDMFNFRPSDYKPPKPERRTQRRGKKAADLEITRQDRTENGRLWGEAKKEAARRKKEKEEKEALKRQKKREYDAQRYQQKKAAREAAQAGGGSRKADT